MKLNDFMYSAFGARFGSQYNKLALEEILDNEDRYPLLTKFFGAINDALESNHYNESYMSSYFGELTVEEAQQLLCAYIAAFGKQVEKYNGKLKSVEAGYVFLDNGDLNSVYFNPENNNIKRKESFILTNDKVERIDEIFNHQRKLTIKKIDTYSGDFKEGLKYINGNIFATLKDLSVMRFSNEDFGYQLENKLEYYIPFYKFCFNGRFADEEVIIFVTEEGFTPTDWIKNKIKDNYEEVSKNN